MNITQPQPPPPSPSPPPPSSGEDDIDDPELEAKMRLYPEDFGLAPRQPPKTFGYEWHDGVVSPFVVSKDKVVTAVLDYLEEGAIIGTVDGPDAGVDAGAVNNCAVVMDIGCGEGTFLIKAAKRFKCQCYGIDIDASLCRRAQEKAAAAGVGHLVQTFEGDLRDLLSSNEEGEGNSAAAASSLSDSDSAAPVVAMRTTLAHTTIFYFYLLPAVLDKLIEPWLMHHLETHPGLTCIFNTWAPSSKELEERFLAPPRDRALHAKRGFFVYQSLGRV